MHLGMSGSFRVIGGGETKTPGIFHYQRSDYGAHDHVVFQMSSGATIAFNDPRRFGCMKLFPRRAIDEEPLLRALGPEPLGNEFDAAMLAQACAGKKTSVKAALLDQRVVAGLGNIYVCEALNRARLSPRRTASTLATRSGAPHERTGLLVDAIKAVLDDAIEAGGSSLARPPPDRRASSAISSTASASMTARASRARRAGCAGHHQAHRADRPLDVLLSGLPEVTHVAKRTARVGLAASRADSGARTQRA